MSVDPKERQRVGVLGGVTWSAFERFSVQGIQFVVFIFMARILRPDDYGLVSLLSFFILISQLIAEGGLSQAIIRKIDRTEHDCSTSFFVNIAIGGILYLLMYCCAPLIARFFDEPRLISIMRVLALSVVIQSTLVVHRALLTSRLDFKTQAKSTLVGALVSGCVGIYMAYTGYGVWAIVGLQLANQFATAATLWIVARWRPRMLFSMESFRTLFGFGSKLLASNVLESLYLSFYSLTIGKIFTPYALGCYSNARQLGSISSENLSKIVQRATYPLFCRLQREPLRLQNSINDYIKLTALIISPLMFGLSALAEPLTIALIGKQWVYTARLLQILSIYFLIYPFNSINFMILEVKGLGALYLKLQLFNILCSLLSLAVMVRFGLSAVCVGLVVSCGVNFMVNAHIAGRKVGLGFGRQLRAIFPLLLNGAICGVIVYALHFLIHHEWGLIVTGALVGLLIYIGLTVVFQNNVCLLLTRIIRHRREKYAN